MVISLSPLSRRYKNATAFETGATQDAHSQIQNFLDLISQDGISSKICNDNTMDNGNIRQKKTLLITVFG